MSANSNIIPMKGVRAMIADHMVKSLATAAQLTHHASANAVSLSQEKSRLAQIGHKVSLEDLLIYETVKTLIKHPYANGRVEERNIVLSNSIHFSVAISLPGDLLVAPAIFDINHMDVVQISQARRDLAQRAKNNQVTVPEMTQGTFTLSNLGLSRVEHFTPIINLPQICILGVGCIQDKPIRTDSGEFDLAPFINLSLTFDHRALDGAPAARFLTDLCQTIESINRVIIKPQE